MSEGIYRGVPPAKLNTDGTPLVDWSITGSENGVGKLGKNYLKPRLEAIPNGAAGTYAGMGDWSDAVTGFTINSGNATRIVFQIRHSDDTDIIPSHVGDVMIVEGSTIPTTYDADTTLCKEPITQGTLINHNYTGGRTIGETQEIFNGEDGGGGWVEYMNNQWVPIPKRCKTRVIEVEPNTDYSVRIFNSSYNNIVFHPTFLTTPGTITPTFTACSSYTQKAIPSNGTFIISEEQWIKLNYSHDRTTEYYPDLPCDVRPLVYKYCDHYATLKAGTYKVMIDCWGNNRFWNTGGYWTGIQDYTGCVYDNANRDQGNNIYEWFSLLEEDDTVIISKSKLLPDGITNKMASISSTPPLPNYFHKEVEFTLDHDAKVGLMHRAYYNSVSEAEEAYFRFMIVDSDVEAVYFETTGADPAQMQGYSAWEKYQVTLPVMVSCADQSQIITFDLNDFLYSEDTISKSSTGIDIPTYAGITDISLMCEAAPTEMYIRYNKGSIGMYCTICGYGGESKAVCPRCGATGYDLLDIPAMAQGPMYAPDELDLIRDEIGFTNPNLHRRAPDDLHIDGTYASINYPSNVPAAYSDIELTTEDGVMKISKYKGTETNICIPEVYVSAGVTTIGLGAFTDTDVVYVEIPDGITTIE